MGVPPISQKHHENPARRKAGGVFAFTYHRLAAWAPIHGSPFPLPGPCAVDTGCKPVVRLGRYGLTVNVPSANPALAGLARMYCWNFVSVTRSTHRWSL